MDKKVFRLSFGINKKNREDILKILHSNSAFDDKDIDTAMWVVDEALRIQNNPDYEFIRCLDNDETIGYLCFGKISYAIDAYEVYWLATKKEYQGMGVGGLLINEAEKIISSRNVRVIFLETSSTEPYKSAREFYLKHNYKIEAVVKDFYDVNDNMVIFKKPLR